MPTEAVLSWRERAVCRRPDLNPDLWVPEVATHRQAAIHICRTHCPVLEQCKAFTRPIAHAVVAGVHYGAGLVNVAPSTKQQAARVCRLCPVPMSAGSRKCGTYGGYATEVAGGDEACPACTAAYRQVVDDVESTFGRPIADVVDDLIHQRIEVTMTTSGTNRDPEVHALMWARTEALRVMAYRGVPDTEIKVVLGYASTRSVSGVRAERGIPAGLSPLVQDRLRREAATVGG